MLINIAPKSLGSQTQCKLFSRTRLQLYAKSNLVGALTHSRQAMIDSFISILAQSYYVCNFKTCNRFVCSTHGTLAWRYVKAPAFFLTISLIWKQIPVIYHRIALGYMIEQVLLRNHTDYCCTLLVCI